MRITFLGTRGEVEERERTHRYQTGLLIEGKEAKILFDCGEERFLAEKPDAIFLTHAHPDHTKGLKKGTELPVYLTRETEEGIRKFGLENRTRLEPGKQTSLKEVKIIPYRVYHSLKAPAVLLKVSEGDFTFIFAPDVLSIPDREKVLEGVDLYIGDGSSLKRNLVRRSDDKVIGHAAVKTQMGWLHKAGVQYAIFTHWGTEAIRLHGNTLKFRIRRFAGPALKAEVARDGMAIDSKDYERLRAREAELLEAVLPYKPKIEKKIDLIRTRDDWRIFGGWYAQLKEKGKFKYSKDEILNKFLIPCLKELIRDGSTEFHPENWKKHPREIYLEAFDKVVKKFRYLVKPHGTMIWEGKKTATVHARRFIQGAFFSIVEGDKEFGFARFEAGRKIDLKEFAKLRNKHQVSDDERKDWWPEARVLYFYKLRTWVPFDKPRTVKVPRGIRTYGSRADLKEAAEGLGEAKYRRDRCMRCEKPPEYEILWAEGMARAWFCEEHLAKWLGESPDRFSQDLSAVKRVVNGEAAKKWKDNPNPDIRSRLKGILEGSACAPAMQRQKINSPTFAYMAVYGKEPDQWIPGRTGGPEKEWRKGIMIDEHLKKEWFDALNSIAGIEVRASCEGHSPERVSYIVFRFRDEKNDSKAEKLAGKLNAEDGIFSLSDIGAENRPRICVAGKTYYGQADWEGWWENLAEKVERCIVEILREGFAAEIFDPKDYEPSKLKGLSDEELLKKREVLIKFFEQRGAKSGDELVINAYRFVKEEIGRRGLKVEFAPKLDELTASLKERALDKYLLERAERIKKLGPIVWKPGFISLTGSALFAERRAPNDLDTVFRDREVNPALLLKVDRIFEKYFGVPAHPIPEPFGPNWRHLPLWDLALVPTKEFEIIEINEPGFMEEFYESVCLTEEVPRAAGKELRKQAADSIGEDEIKMNRFFLGLKPTRPAFPEERMTLESLLKFFKPEDFPVYVEKKYD